VVTGSKESNVDNLHNARRKVTRHFRNKKKGHVKTKINYLETNRKNKNIRELCRDISDIKKGFQPKTNIKDKTGNLVADSHSILVRCWKIFSQLLNVCKIMLGRLKYIRQNHSYLILVL
jgi:hypothetical protein